MTASSLLFTPFTLGPLTLRNRTIRAAAFEGMCPGHEPSAMLMEYHRSVAAGGVGMTTVAYASVTRDGLSFPHQMWIRPEIIPGLRQLSDAVHQEGAAISIQLGHCGNMAKPSVAGRRPLSPSGGFNMYAPAWTRKMSKDDIHAVVKSFGDAVRMVKDAGFDAVEIHAGHGYLISQFLSPYTNHRRDEFGGTLENRARFMRLVMDEVLEAAGNEVAVLVKMNMRDGFSGGMETDECLEVARILESQGVHALVLSGGFVSKAPMYVMRGKMPVRTLTHYMQSLPLKIATGMFAKWLIPEVPFREAYFLEEALQFRSAVHLPLVYVGGVKSRSTVDQVLNSGFELVAMARALINEPGLVQRMKTDEKAVGGCVASNYCIARMYSREMACHQHIPDLPVSILKDLDRSSAKHV